MGSDDMHCTVYDVRCYRLRCCIAVPFFVSTTAHEDVKHHPLLAAVTVLSAPMLFQDQQKKKFLHSPSYCVGFSPLPFEVCDLIHHI